MKQGRLTGLCANTHFIIVANTNQPSGLMPVQPMLAERIASVRLVSHIPVSQSLPSPSAYRWFLMVPQTDPALQHKYAKLTYVHQGGETIFLLLCKTAFGHRVAKRAVIK